MNVATEVMVVLWRGATIAVVFKLQEFQRTPSRRQEGGEGVVAGMPEVEARVDCKTP